MEVGTLWWKGLRGEVGCEVGEQEAARTVNHKR